MVDANTSSNIIIKPKQLGLNAPLAAGKSVAWSKEPDVSQSVTSRPCAQGETDVFHHWMKCQLMICIPHIPPLGYMEKKPTMRYDDFFP